VRRTRVLVLVTLFLLVLARRAHPADRPSSRPVLDRVERHAVLVVIGFQRDLKAEAEGAVGPDPNSSTEVFRRWRMSMRVPGFVVRDRRTVVLSDVFLPPGAIRSVSVESRDGTAVPGRLHGVLPRCGAVVVTTDADLPAEPVPFPARVDVTEETPLYAGSVAEGIRGLETWVEALGGVRRRAWRGAGFSYGLPDKTPAGLSGTNRTRTADLVVREDGAPMGLRFCPALDLFGSTWRGPDVLADLARVVPFASLDERAAALNESSHVHRVRITFQPASADPDALLAGPFGPFGTTSPTPEPDDETRWWGLAIAADRLLVPAVLPDAWVRRIGRIVVEEDGGPVYEAVFEGRLKSLGAFVVRIDGATVEAMPDRRPPFPPAEHAFLVHRIGWRAGARRDLVEYDRSLGRARGYGDLAYDASEEAVPAGSFLLDLDGNVLGAAVELLPHDVDRAATRRGGDDETGRGVVAATFADLGAPASIADDLDRRVMPVASRDARKRMWLGVEYEPVRGATVAEALDVTGPTRDGTRGLLVNVVHAGSPAARAGVRPDDLLLAARRLSADGTESAPVDLRDSAGAVDWSDDAEFARPWAPRVNALVRLLEAWGEGTRYRVEALRAGEATTFDLAVETAPHDVSNAPGTRDDDTGLAVKELTYEVRHGLRLAPDAPGVLVADVEEGSPAHQARIARHEVLTEVDGTPVRDPHQFADLLAAARAKGRTDVRAVVLRLDRSRFVDLRIRPPGAVPPVGR
jgi:hypothetical protein